MSIIYSTTTSARDAAKENPLIGKYTRPIRAIIEAESNLLEKRHTILDVLYNVEKSNRFAEAITAESGFGVFGAKAEGEKSDSDTTKETFTKYIEHISFGKDFTITREMLDDAKIGMGTQMKQRPKAFIRAYYATRVKLAAQALYKATASTMTWAYGAKSETVDLTTGDGKPLFSTAHPFADSTVGEAQSNYFETAAITDVEETLSILSNKIRNFKDERGEPLGYVADVVIIPCNRPALERKVKAACGSERTTGNGNNDINTQYGNWTVVVLDGWETTYDAMMVMSKEANEMLLGNMFYNRVDLDIRDDVENSSRNWVWNGYCRMGVGFTTWKHIALLTTDSAATATPLD